MERKRERECFIMRYLLIAFTYELLICKHDMENLLYRRYKQLMQ